MGTQQAPRLARPVKIGAGSVVGVERAFGRRGRRGATDRGRAVDCGDGQRGVLCGTEIRGAAVTDLDADDAGGRRRRTNRRVGVNARARNNARPRTGVRRGETPRLPRTIRVKARCVVGVGHVFRRRRRCRAVDHRRVVDRRNRDRRRLRRAEIRGAAVADLNGHHAGCGGYRTSWREGVHTGSWNNGSPSAGVGAKQAPRLTRPVGVDTCGAIGIESALSRSRRRDAVDCGRTVDCDHVDGRRDGSARKRTVVADPRHRTRKRRGCDRGVVICHRA